MVGEWREVRIAELGRVVTGRTPPGNEPAYYGADVPFLTPSDLGDQRRVERTARALSAFGVAQLARCLVPEGVGVSCIGWQMGKAVLIDRPTITNQQINSIVVEQKIADARFVYYSLQNRRDELFGLGAGGSRTPILNKGDFERLPFVLPPLHEQRAIALILGTLDNKIELNRRTNETLEAIARAIFQSWFVDFDPVRAKASGEPPESICRRLGLTPELLSLFPDRLVNSELGEIPEGWSTPSLYEMADYINGAAYSAFAPNDARRGLPIIKIAELKADITALTKYSDAQMPEKYLIDCRDILFSWSGNPDTSIDTFVWSHGAAWLNQHVFRVVPRSDIERSFVLVLLKYLRPVFAEVARNKQTTGLGHVTIGDLKRMMCVKPSGSLLVAWNDRIGPILDRAFLANIENHTLADCRDSLLPKLLSGAIRVPVESAA